MMKAQYADRKDLVQGGFTLLELLLATLTFATLILALKLTLFTCLNLREKAQATIDELIPKHQALQFIRRDLMNCVMNGEALMAQYLLGETTGAINVQDDSIEFHTSTGILKDYTVWPGLQRVRYSLMDPLVQNRNLHQGKDLVRSITRNLLSGQIEIPEDQRILSGVHSLGILYYDGESWVDSWDSELSEEPMPSAVRFTIEMASAVNARGRQRAPIDLVVPIVVKPFHEDSEEEDGEIVEGENDDGGQV